MRALLAFLAKRCRMPLQDGFTELDAQIDKLRQLRDSYQAPKQTEQNEPKSETEKNGGRLCMP